MEPLVSILIPAFNTEAFVADAIRSALAQTWQRTEIIVVDDGSTDRTADVCRGFASSKVAIITEPHQGAAAARNKALSLSQGDYIQWLDADDILAPDKIAKQLESVAGDRDGRTLLSCAWAYFHHSPRRARFVPTRLWADLSPVDWLLCKLQHNVYMQNATWLVSREVTDAAGPWDTRLTADDDGEYFCRVLLASQAVRFIPEARAFYRRNVGGLHSIGGSKQKIESQFLSTQMHIHYLRSLEDSERVRVACLTSLQCFFTFVYPASPDIIDRSQRLATSLGGRLVTPRLSWKYSWIERLFGRPAAKRTSVFYNHYKGVLLAFWNRVRERLEDRSWAP